MLNDMGILADSVRYYHDADPFTATNLYHVPHAGSYHCDETYGMQRNYLDICQMLVVDEGELSVTYRGETRTAGPGSLILLDCREPHSYHALTPIRMRWFHFAGSGSTAYTHLILNTHGFILPTGSNAEIEECIRRIMVSVHQNQPNPHIISLTINKLLVLLVLVLGEKKKSDLEIAIQDSADYMTYNYADKSLSIEHLSQRAALSTCYYMRKFKEYQSVTPHQFLQTVRLSAAKQQLLTTSQSIETIADNCGFSSASHFIMAFRKSTSITPHQYRTQWK